MAAAQGKTNQRPQPAVIADEEFEPLCKWKRGEDKDVLEVYLQDFRKEQLKVQITNHGMLKVSGDRPLDASRRSKFYKEVPLARHVYDTSAIRAKYVNGCLSITLSKLPQQTPEPEAEPKPTSATPSEEDRSKTTQPQPQPQPQTLKDKDGSVREAMVAVMLATIMAFLAYAIYICLCCSEKHV